MFFHDEFASAVRHCSQQLAEGRWHRNQRRLRCAEEQEISVAHAQREGGPTMVRKMRVAPPSQSAGHHHQLKHARDWPTEKRYGMVFRRRPLRAAAVVGGTAYIAGKAGAKAGAANAPAAQQAPAEPDAVAPPTETPSTATAPSVEAPPAEALPKVESTEDKMDQLAKLKQLLDMQALTQEEFDTQKARILASM